MVWASQISQGRDFLNEVVFIKIELIVFVNKCSTIDALFIDEIAQSGDYDQSKTTIPVGFFNPWGLGITSAFDKTGPATQWTDPPTPPTTLSTSTTTTTTTTSTTTTTPTTTTTTPTTTTTSTTTTRPRPRPTPRPTVPYTRPTDPPTSYYSSYRPHVDVSRFIQYKSVNGYFLEHFEPLSTKSASVNG